MTYHNDPKFFGQTGIANISDTDPTAPAVSVCYHYLHQLDKSHQGRTSELEFESVHSKLI